MELSYSEITRQLNEKNYCLVPFDINRPKLEKVAGDFLDFLKLPQPTKEQFHFKLDETDRGSNVGYRIKSKSVGDMDNKEYFHYNEYAKREFIHLLNDPVSEKFLRSADMVYEAGKRKMSEIVRKFDKEFPGIYSKMFTKKGFPRFYLRFLKYSTASTGEFLAEGHYDRGTCTLAIAESSPGLRIGWDRDRVYPVEHADGKAIFMPSLTFPEVTSSRFNPAWHDVVQKADAKVNKDVARWAIVLFADTFDVRDVTFEEAHGIKKKR